ncbi:MAG: OmpA family protein [bacterium]
MPKILKIITAILGLLIIWLATLYLRRSPIEQDLTNHAEEALNRSDFSRVAVSFVGRDGTLTGKVDTPELSEEAERLAKRYWGVRVIDNQLKVSPEDMKLISEDTGELAIQKFMDFFDSNPIEFDFASSKLSVRSKRILDRAVELIDRITEPKIEIGGHTDNVGSDAWNTRLSAARANSVRMYLIEKGIQSGFLSVNGFGETQPKADNDTEGGRQKNRRVEFKVK